MKLLIKLLLIAVALLGLWSGESFAEPPTYYTWLTHFERTRFNEYIRFWERDSSFGTIRSNDYIAIMGNPLLGLVITSQDRFIGNNENLNFEHIFNAPPYEFPESYPHLRHRASPRISDINGRMMTRIRMYGNGGIEFYQHPLGNPHGDSLVMSIAAPYNRIIYVDGQVEVEGVLAGRVTIYSSGEMWLVDDIRYVGADQRTGRFGRTREEMRDFPHVLGLVSDQNIIIKNTTANGRENGWAFGGQVNRTDRHSIVINAALIALNESFTFQHQNDRFNRYQGPTPDDRGIIHLTGGVTQYRRGYVHRSNHQSTGYGKDYMYDYRLETTGPPGFAPGEYPDVSGNYDVLDLFVGPYTLQNTHARKVIIRRGVEVNLMGGNSLTVRDSLIVEGTEEEPVTFRSVLQNGRSRIAVNGHNRSLIDLNHATFSRNVTVRMQANSIVVNNCEFGTDADFEGNVTLNSSRFNEQVRIIAWDDVSISRSLFMDGITLTGNLRNGELINNTISGGRSAGVEIHRFDSLRLVNNIISDNRYGIVNRHWNRPTVEYCDVYGNRSGDYIDCEPGEGSISVTPRFIDPRNDNYRLAWNSPCIDAGDPASPHDPDSTRADIGAFYRDRNLSVSDAPTVPDQFRVTASPNPFNSTVTVQFTLTHSETARLTIYDLQGRKIQSQRETFTAGVGKITVSGELLGSAGVYFARLSAGDQVGTVKLVYVP